MSEIWNLSAICRCCHCDGQFKGLQVPYMFQGTVEIFTVMLRDTFGVSLNPPPPQLDASHTICDDCIIKLRTAARFKRQVLECEYKFEEYCKNELSCDNVKVEIDLLDNDFSDSNGFDNRETLGMINAKCNEVNRLQDDKSIHLTDGNDLKFECDYNVDKSEDKKIKQEDGTLNKEIEITMDNKPTSKVASKTTLKRNKATLKKPKTVKKGSFKRYLKTDLSLEVHVKTENGELFSCKSCGGSYNTVAKLRRHISDNHLDTHQKCEICNKKLKYPHSYNNHMKGHLDEKPYQCDFCLKQFAGKAVFLEHRNKHTKENIFKCDLCSKEFHYKQSLRQHLRWHSGTNKRCICDTCGRSFNDRTNLAIHVRTVHEGVKAFACDVCRKRFSANKHLKVHYMTHTGERPFECDLCPKSFTNVSSMKKHREIHDKTQRYTCVVCRQKYSDRGQFRKHVRSHAGSLPHKCHICSKDFSCKYSLKRHVEEHSGFRAHTCEICQKSFTQKAQVNRHKRNVHDPHRVAKEKVKCVVCKQNVSDIEKHKLTHSNRPFACEHCDKTYSERNALNRHVQTKHFGVKPHTCGYCNKKYVQKFSLKSHLAKVHRITGKNDTEESFESIVTAFRIKNENIKT